MSVSPLAAASPTGGPGGNMLANANMMCGMLQPGSVAATSNDCRLCHGRQADHGHPTEFDYARWSRGSGTIALRPVSEVQRRGLSLPDGQVRCVTCHDASSPWKFHIKLPQGAKPVPGVDLRRPMTYESARALPPPQPGDDVAKKSLCVACHALD
ncbi:MAG: hypothetical protein HYU51_16395 [Candidatus Rokubacteria bacterium]|nr:hypothetical protein [Candidatus Rokubacteria bacterium]